MEVQDLLKYMLEFFQTIDDKRNKLNTELSTIDIKQQELLHYIENHSFNAAKSCHIIKQLKKIRYERRQIKNQLEIVNGLKDTFADKYKNKFIEKDIIEALKRMKNLEERHQNPKYVYKFLDEEGEINE